MSDEALWALSYRRPSSTGLRRGEIAPREVLDALAERIAAVDAKVNALPTLCFERARKARDAARRRPALGGPARSPIAGADQGCL